MAKDTITVPLTFSRPTHARLSKLKDVMGVSWEEFFLMPYEEKAKT